MIPSAATSSTPPKPAGPARRLVFISHANPEENDFVRWLGVQLASAGYEVWSDVTKLIGGELFWEDIEDAIRHHTAKFILVVSSAALKKEGVKDEIHLAVTVERSDKIENFLLPVRVDDVPYSDFKGNIARKNVIDFKAGWAPALARVFQVLERDGIPKGAIAPADVASWCLRRFDT
ncbi:toll/interleukin-1 receptor domain-containing protein, partial [Pseudomonas syringae]|uniref:toll/interleukin-1 receptor domain-containing protein n=1 Tax=Pseudomonas syringae TaxID=317 RepID=UPI001587FE36